MISSPSTFMACNLPQNSPASSWCPIAHWLCILQQHVLFSVPEGGLALDFPSPLPEHSLLPPARARAYLSFKPQLSRCTPWKISLAPATHRCSCSRLPGPSPPSTALRTPEPHLQATPCSRQDCTGLFLFSTLEPDRAQTLMDD